MNNFVRCNKISGIYWPRGSLENMQITVKIKPPEDIISLPKFEDYTNNSSNFNLEQNLEEFSFRWQEKSFSVWETQQYTDIHNCVTDNELKYHEILKSDREISSNKVFSYIHEDCYLPLPVHGKVEKGSLSSWWQNLEEVFSRIGDTFIDKTVSERQLFKSEEDICDNEEVWRAMHIVFDNSDYNDGCLLIRQDAILLSLYHNISQNYLMVSPDSNNLETNPYTVECNGEPIGYQYEVTVDLGEMGSSEELNALLTKLYNKWEKRHKLLVNFEMPLLGKKHHYVSIDLLSAMDFKEDSLFIQYDIKLPEAIKCDDALHGRTHISEATSIDSKNVSQFGHVIDLCLECDTGSECPPIRLYFEIISIDWWHRHQTEGYSYITITLKPGLYSKELTCSRPDERGADERRFFLGGCHLIKDLEVLSKPELQNGDYTYVSTGTIQLRYNVISQSPTAESRAVPPGGSSSSDLLLGAEAALRKYKRARERLAAAAGELSMGQRDEVT